MKIDELKYYDKIKDWDFSEFEIVSEKLTSFDMYEILKDKATKQSKILDLGTGGGERLLKNFPDACEILGIDFSDEMIKTANINLKKSKRKNIEFKVMNNLEMNVPKNYYDIIVARNTVIDSKQIYAALKVGGYVIVHGVDKYDCHELKLIFGKGQAMNDKKPISIIDYENLLLAGFNDVELIPIHVREYFKDINSLYKFLLKVPIINDFSEEQGNLKNCYDEVIDMDKLDKYVKRNTYQKGIRLIRRYYGIVAKK